MLLYADEDFPHPAVEELRRLGHDVLTAQADGLTSSPDHAILARAHSLSRVVLTLNRSDFERLDRHGQLAVDAVVAQQHGQVLGVGQVVDRRPADVPAARTLLVCLPQRRGPRLSVTTAAEALDHERLHAHIFLGPHRAASPDRGRGSCEAAPQLAAATRSAASSNSSHVRSLTRGRPSFSPAARSRSSIDVQPA